MPRAAILFGICTALAGGIPPPLSPQGNRLAGELSPYLRQHSRNPVDWYPWGEAAFRRARELDRPILLSVGYSSCHWCHVMNRESFQSEEIAGLLNREFVCIKVDREERPDVDDVYLTAVQLASGRGGWPMTVFLLPDGRPFFGATYYPPDSFKRLLGQISSVWKDRRHEVERQAESLTAAVRLQMESSARGSPRRGLLQESVAQLRSEFDEANGGFGDPPRFPPHNSFPLLFHAFEKGGDRKALRMALKTLDGIARGGIRDHVGGGFHRYCTDARWRVPHFEKMLYDNALLARAYGEAFRLTGKALYRQVARETLEWALREMRGPEGGFYSAIDAESEGEEGRYYVWKRAEVMSVLGSARGERFCRAYSVMEGGNYEDERTRHRNGRNILFLSAPETPELRADLWKLLAARAKRPAPAVDDKRIASWNALMVSALARCGALFKEARYLDAAAKAADSVLSRRRTDGQLLRRWRPAPESLSAMPGVASSPIAPPERHIPGFLEDYAYLADALLDLSEATGSPQWRAEARAVADALIARFADPKGGFFDTPQGFEGLIARGKSVYDSALPSPTGVAIRALLRLARIAGDRGFLRRAREALESVGGSVNRMPRAAQTLVLAAELYAPSPRGEAPPSRASAGPVTVEIAPARKPGFIEVRITVAPGWHINANRPQEKGLTPTTVRIEAMGARPGVPVYPRARMVRLGFAKRPLAVYTGRVVISVPIKPSGAGQTQVSVTAAARFQACDDRTCLEPATLRVSTRVRHAQAR